MHSNVCLDCGEVLDTCRGVKADDARPSPGDITVCLYCGHVMAFTEGLGLRALTDAEVVAVAGNKELLKAQAVAGMWRDEMAKPK